VPHGLALGQPALVTEPSESAGTTRLTVNLPADTRRALDQVVERDQVTTTAALCRLVALGEVLDQMIQRGDAVWVGKGDKLERLRFVH
jgi:hypothetical protein